jgi:predicted ATPase
MSANARPLRPSGAGASAAAARLPARPFVGRAEELRLLQGALDDAVGGRGSLLLVTGEAGIGKTRLVQELVAVAGRRCHPLFGRCWEEGGAPAYWPWIQVVRAAGGDFEALAAPPAEAPLEPETVRFRLFDAAASFVLAAALRRPLVIVLDDLHAADAASLLLLRFVGEAIGAARVLIVGSYREQDPRVAELGDV